MSLEKFWDERDELWLEHLSGRTPSILFGDMEKALFTVEFALNHAIDHVEDQIDTLIDNHGAKIGFVVFTAMILLPFLFK